MRSSGKFAARAISSAFALSMPVSGLTSTRASASGFSTASYLDLHAALDRAEAQVGAVRTVEQHREVELLRDARALGDHDALDDVTLDVEAEDRLRGLVRLVGCLGDLDASGLAATTGLDLSLDDDDTADLLGSRFHLLRSVRDDTGENRHPVLLEKVSCLVLVEIHVQSFAGCGGWDATECRLPIDESTRETSLLLAERPAGRPSS